MAAVSSILTLSLVISCLNYLYLVASRGVAQNLIDGLLPPFAADPIWWLTRLISWSSVGEAIAGTILLVQADLCEKAVWGSRHTVVVLTCAFIASLLSHGLWEYLLLDKYCRIQPGPYWAVLSCTGRYMVNAPVRARWRIASSSMIITDKWFLCLLAVQIACCDIPASLLASVPGFLIGTFLGFFSPNISLPETCVPICQSICWLSPTGLMSSCRWAYTSWNNLDLRTTRSPSANMHAPAIDHSAPGVRLGHGARAHTLVQQQTPTISPDEDEEVQMQRALLLSQQTALQEQAARRGNFA
jgi:hypothetical protein